MIHDKNFGIFIEQFCQNVIMSVKTKDKYFTLFHTIISYSGIKYFNKIFFCFYIFQLDKWMLVTFLFKLAVIDFYHLFKKNQQICSML